MTYEYGRKALYYAEKLKEWIEALDIAEHILHYVRELLIPEDEARSVYIKVSELFSKALNLDEDHARYHYAFAISHWVRYALRSLHNPEEANSSLEKAFKEVGSRGKRKIEDELLWHDAYSTLLTAKSDVLITKRDFKEALNILKEKDELLEHYKDEIIKRISERAYYEGKSIIMNRLGYLTLITAESEDDLERAQEYYRDSILHALKVESKEYVVANRVNLAKIQMLLAKNQGDFERVYRDLEDYLKIFEEVGDKHGEALAKHFMAICCLALKHDSDALKFAEESMEIVEKGPNEYFKAASELTLAYIKITSRLSDFKRGEISNEIYELIRSAYERLENIREIKIFIALAVEVVAKYLQNKIKYDELLNGLDRFAETLKIGKYILGSWVIKQFMNTVKEKGDIDEDILRLKGIKLLLAI
jgi:tetratricopeptide (TPR) repeat protein